MTFEKSFYRTHDKFCNMTNVKYSLKINLKPYNGVIVCNGSTWAYILRYALCEGIDLLLYFTLKSTTNVLETRNLMRK